MPRKRERDETREKCFFPRSVYEESWRTNPFENEKVCGTDFRGLKDGLL